MRKNMKSYTLFYLKGDTSIQTLTIRAVQSILATFILSPYPNPILILISKPQTTIKKIKQV